MSSSNIGPDEFAKGVYTTAPTTLTLSSNDGTDRVQLSIGRAYWLYCASAFWFKMGTSSVTADNEAGTPTVPVAAGTLWPVKPTSSSNDYVAAIGTTDAVVYAIFPQD